MILGCIWVNCFKYVQIERNYSRGLQIMNNVLIMKRNWFSISQIYELGST